MMSYNFDLEFVVPLVANCQDGLIEKVPLPLDGRLSIAGYRICMELPLPGSKLYPNDV